MGRNKKILPLLQGVTITDLASEGKALFHHEGMVVFVPFGAPGDVCDVQIVSKKKNFMEGRIVHTIEPSPIRRSPVCDHFGYCGGCKWQHLPYEEQLKMKNRTVRDAMERIGKLIIPEYLPILESETEYRYRNKLEFSFSHKRWLLPHEKEQAGETITEPGLGFHIPGMFDKVLDIHYCHLGDRFADEIRLFIRNFCLKHIEDYPFFDLKLQEGLMRNLMVRTASTGQTMVLLSFYHNDETNIKRLLDAVRLHFPEITSLIYVINPKANDTFGDLEILCHSGQDYIEEEMEGLKFRIGAKSFYQTNSRQAHRLYEVARSFAALTGNELVYDLYTGTGTIANFIARKACRVIGVEYVPEAIEDAKLNSKVNGIENTLFYAGDMKDVLNEDFIVKHGRPDVIITDPPRAGMHADVIKTILRATPQRIVYVSCNPATQARDLSLLVESGTYKILKSRAVDMFPQTHHVENVVLLECC